MEVTLLNDRVRPFVSLATFCRVLVVSTFALFVASCATNKPQARTAPKVVVPEPAVTYAAPKPAHKTEMKLAAAPQVLFMPVKGVTQKQIKNNFGDYRNGGRTHKGIDIFAPSGRELLAVTSGYLERTSSKLGGNSVYLRGDNGLTYYYAHLSRYHPKARSGERVDGGMVIGYVGNTGNARSTPAHLHFEIRKKGVPFNPYTTLRDPDLVITPIGASTPVDYAENKTPSDRSSRTVTGIERPAPAKHSGGAARSSTSTATTKKSAPLSSIKAGSAAKKLAAKQTKKQQLASKKAKLKANGKKKQYTNKAKPGKKKYAAKGRRRGYYANR
jgi:peptidoglycan LD-endopeptidase LytH